MGVAGSMLSFLLLALFVCAPLAAGIWLIVTARRRGLGYPACGACQYDLTGRFGMMTTCPECGASLAEAGVLPARAAVNRPMLVTGIALCAVPLLCAGAGLIFMMVTRAELARARQLAAPQAATRQTTVAVTSGPPDPNAVAAYRLEWNALSATEASDRLHEVTGLIKRAIKRGDSRALMDLHNQQQALIDHLHAIAPGSIPDELEIGNELEAAAPATAPSKEGSGG